MARTLALRLFRLGPPYASSGTPVIVLAWYPGTGVVHCGLVLTEEDVLEPLRKLEALKKHDSPEVFRVVP